MILSKQTQKAKEIVLNTIRENYERQKVNFLLPIPYFSQDSATVASMFHQFSNQWTKDHSYESNYRTVFANSHLEALWGAVKLMRHNASQREMQYPQIFIYDSDEQLNAHINPLKLPQEEALIPGIVVLTSCDDLHKEILSTPNVIGVIVCLTQCKSLSEIAQLFNLCRKHHILTGLSIGFFEECYPQMPQRIFSRPPDIVIWGENMTCYQVPFGAFSAQETIYAPWNTWEHCMTHSSTYSGNALAMSVVLTLCKEHQLVKLQENLLLPSIIQIQRQFAIYINEKIALIHRALNLSPIVIKAKGGRLITLKQDSEEKEVLDCVSASGCSLRGHHPVDIPEVINSHLPDYDYWALLSQKIKELANREEGEVFSAVSGSTAVDTAIMLSVLAMYPKKKILIFNNNYSGKTLISLSVTAFNELRAPFLPLYPHVVIFDYLQTQAAEKLEALLAQQDIGLVWFELMQGENLQTIPQTILKVIEANKERDGYLIGVDEVLTGCFRTGTFLFSEGKIHADVISLSKAMSDMTFPIAAVMCSQTLYQKAKQKDGHCVSQLQSMYRNQLGAQIALNSLRWAQEQQLGEHVKQMSKLCRELLTPAISCSSCIEELCGEGLLLYLKPKNSWVVRLIGENLFAFFFASELMQSAKILTLYNLLTPALTISKEEVQLLCQRLSRVIEHSTPFKVVCKGVGRLLREKLFRFGKTLKSQSRQIRLSTVINS